MEDYVSGLQRRNVRWETHPNRPEEPGKLSAFTVLGVRYEFIFITGRKFFSVTKQCSDGAEFSITDREKTFIDALDGLDLCGGLPVVVDALSSQDSLDWDKLDKYLKRIESGAIYKRLRYLVEKLVVPVPEAPRRLPAWRRQFT